jgi:hypothetical protein
MARRTTEGAARIPHPFVGARRRADRNVDLARSLGHLYLMSMGSRYGWLACCLISGCYLGHGDGALQCEVPEATSWPCGEERYRSALPSVVCHLEDGTWLGAIDADVPLHCESRAVDGFFRASLAECMAPGPEERHTARCGIGPDTAMFSRDPLRITTSVELPPGRCVATASATATTLADRFVARTEYTQLCDDPLAHCGVPLVFDVHLDGYDPCAGARYLERCEVRVEGDRLVVSIADTERTRIPCEADVGDRIATCVAPPLEAGTYTVVDTAGRVLGDIDVPLEADPPREPRCVPIE